MAIAWLDSERRQFHKELADVERHREQASAYVEQELAHCYLVDDKKVSIANSERQMGRALAPIEFIKFVEAANPKLRVQPHPWRPDKLCIYQFKQMPSDYYDEVSGTFGGEQKVFIAATENGIMPEWSIMGTREVEVPTNEFRLSSNRPAMKKVRRPWREERRGWRSALALLVLGDLLPAHKVERFVAQHGSQDREAWKLLMGKGKLGEYATL